MGIETARDRDGLVRLIVAAAGYGKSAALEIACPADGLVAPATSLLDGDLPAVSFLGVDDVDRLDAHDQPRLAHRLGQVPPSVTLMLASRTPVAAAALAQLRGPVFRSGPADLALGEYRVARVLEEEYAIDDPEAASAVVEATDGWPALVHFAGDVLRRDPTADIVEHLARAGSGCAGWVDAHVAALLPPGTASLLGTLFRLGPAVPGVMTALVDAVPGPRATDPEAVLRELEETGLVVRRPGLDRSGPPTVVPVVGACLADRAAAVPGEVLERVARAYEEEGLWLSALRAWTTAGDERAVIALATEHGRLLARGGHPDEVAELLAAATDPSVLLVRAEALRLAGDTEAGRRILRPLLEQSRGTDLPPGLATCLAGCLYTEGDHRAALAALDRVPDVGAGSGIVRVEWLAARAQVLSMLGGRGAAADVAAQALREAVEDGTPGALAAAHLAASRVSTGTRKELHLDRALRHAVEAGDLATAAGVRVNQAHLLLAGARFLEAARVGREAVRLCTLAGGSGRLPAAMHNLGEALMRIGDYGEAAWQYRRGAAVSSRLGAGRAGLGLLGIGEIHRELGRDEQARAAYGEAVDLATATGELQVLVPALAGLARLEAGHGDDRAMATATRAVELATPALLPFALLGLGWTAVSLEQWPVARDAVERAVRESRDQAAADLLAESLELAAVVETDPHRSRMRLNEALSIWSAGGATPACARVQVELGRLVGADATARATARDAANTLRRLGVPESRVLHGAGSSDRAIRVRVLGRFRVSVQGRVVPLQKWRSRQARTLLKVLVAHRGRPVSRERLCELLWPDDDPVRTPHRLSVLLSTVRTVLDPDKAWPAEQFVASDGRGLWLNLDTVSVDVEDYLTDADEAASLLQEGRAEAALLVLADLDRRHPGQALEDEADEAWAAPLREEVRIAQLRTLRRLATTLGRLGRAAQAQDTLVRLLTIEPFDEQVHRLLVRSLAGSGRHGEAERAFDRWREAMIMIGAPPPERGPRLTDV
ncbi:hypothetical protein HN031_15415 [Nocardioides sp. zg-1308]|uniref:BTAD domain-containing putative transcriptional regulator n=1 Tax=Nocardioides sp. zg-1308 TaxID=2736253 RepID=UPI001554C6C1|nr:BTAD domain-containing putative transcriptional regulator [Nocardioides sp. zg-1308]NPD06068.1 hypothetical protein [Nocardioides sp. zg-1308]